MRIVVAMVVVVLALQPAGVRAQRSVQQSRAAAAAGAVRISTGAGQLRVLGWERDSIAVSGTVAAGTRLVLDVRGASARIRVEADSGDGEGVLEVRVPAGSQVWVNGTTADVRVGGVTGDVNVNTVTGAVEVRDRPAELHAESMGGTITLELDTRVLRARSGSGAINVRGRALDAEVYSVSGLIEIANKQVERGRFESVDGGVRYRGYLARAANVEFITHSGDIDVSLPVRTNAAVRISSYQGTVTSQLGKLRRTSEGRGGSEYTLELGDAGADLVIRTFKGRVRITPM